MPGHPSLRDLPRPIAFALSGGVSLGALQVGQMRALMEFGIVPDMLVGTSAGALNCAWMGQGWTADRLEQLAEVWRTVRFRDVFGPFPLAGTVRLLFGGQSLVTNKRLRVMAERWLPQDHASLPLDTTVIAADLQRGRPVPLRTGDLRANILASTALPGVFPPVEIDGRLLVDGGIAENVPMAQAARLGAQTIVVLDASYPCQLDRLPDDVIARTILVINHTIASQALGTLAMVPSDRTVLYLPGPCPLTVAPGEFRHGAALIEQAYGTVLPFLADLQVGGAGIYGDPQFYLRTREPV